LLFAILQTDGSFRSPDALAKCVQIANGISHDLVSNDDISHDWISDDVISHDCYNDIDGISSNWISNDGVSHDWIAQNGISHDCFSYDWNSSDLISSDGVSHDGISNNGNSHNWATLYCHARAESRCFRFCLRTMCWRLPVVALQRANFVHG
jgi:hypothetical protein